LQFGQLLDKRLEDDKDYGLSIFKPMNIGGWMKWLNDRAKGSVVYVSFGSMATFKAEQMEEVAWGLRMSDNYLLLMGGQCIRKKQIKLSIPLKQDNGFPP
jgi:hypothetical protein